MSALTGLPGRTLSVLRMGRPHFLVGGLLLHWLGVAMARSIGASLTNFTQQPTAFRLELEVAADFAGQSEARGERQQQGELTSTWRQAATDAWELTFYYRVEHTYDQQGNQGTASLHRAVTLRIERATSTPSYRARSAE